LQGAADVGRGLSQEGVVRNGWLNTGDLGSVDADGFVCLAGRAKDRRPQRTHPRGHGLHRHAPAEDRRPTEPSATPLRLRHPAALRPGGLIPNPLVSAGDGTPARLDSILAGRTAVLTARRLSADLVEF
jgi:hypothetical protein